MEQTFPRDIQSLETVFGFLKDQIDSLSLDDRTAFAVNMAVEELFTNMVKYNRMGDSGIEISVDREGDQVVIRMVDSDSEPFDITALDEVDTSAPLEARRPGGLGIHLVQCLMDEVSYEYKNRRTSIRLAKLIS